MATNAIVCWSTGYHGLGVGMGTDAGGRAGPDMGLGSLRVLVRGYAVKRRWRVWQMKAARATMALAATRAAMPGIGCSAGSVELV
ncbi:hypothetical protein [Winogradskya consettensis]|uniref:hypothetical protein n=1 Tax=Winogradskya consettensis TaxID=113560 RepID=UPI001BB2F575|nr:hypothetical protein [Actinoplanes consettensis]